MKGIWRPLLMAAVLCTAGFARVADAQTIIVRHVPPDVTVEASLDTRPAVQAVLDPAGNARIALNAIQGTAEASVRVFLYACDSRRRLALVGRDAPIPPMPTECVRKDLSGVFVLRPVTTLVLNLAESTPIVLIAQGQPPREWLEDIPEQAEGVKVHTPAPGLMVFGGGGWSNFRENTFKACGQLVTSCSGGDLRMGTTIGATYWMSPFIAAEVSFAKDRVLTAFGNTPSSSFTTTVDPEILIINAKVGVPVHERVTFYGTGGIDHHRATTTTTDIADDLPVTIDGVSQTLTGGTLKTSYRTAGWSWAAGGGVDIWVSRHFGIYLEGRFADLKGSDVTGGEARRDQIATSVQTGIRFRFAPPRRPVQN
jgi:opacity protein-like surface antigen